MPAAFRESQAHRHSKVERGFLIHPELAGGVIDQLLEERLVPVAEDWLQLFDQLFLPLKIRGRKKFVVSQRVQEIVVLGRALLFDIAEVGVPYSFGGQIDALGSCSCDFHQVV
jgi:hypothetical protein